MITEEWEKSLQTRTKAIDFFIKRKSLEKD